MLVDVAVIRLEGDCRSAAVSLKFQSKNDFGREILQPLH
jgi:hypothetical protein